MNGRYAVKRLAVVLACSVLLLGMLSFGLPTPYIVDDGTPDVQTQQHDAMITQDAEALACGGVCVAAVAVTAATTGTVVGAGYFEEDPDSQSSAFYTASSLDDRIETDYNNLNSSLEETRTMAYRVAETSYAKAIANDKSKVTAKEWADENTTDYIVQTLDDEFVRRNNAYVSSMYQLEQTSGVSVEHDTNTISAVEYKNVSVFSSSPEGKTFNVSRLGVDSQHRSWISPYSKNADVITSSDDYDKVDITTRQGNFDSLFTDYKDIRGEVVNEIDSFDQSINESQYEDLNASDIVSPVNEAAEWGESYEDTGSSGYASALASSLGYAVNETGTVYSVQMPAGSGAWYNGTVYADESTIPNGTIETGRIYNGSTTTAWVATSSGTEELDKDWEVYEIELADGNTTDSASLSTWSRQDLNSSDPLETLQKWQKIQDELGPLSGGFGLFDGSGSGPLGISWIVWILGGGLFAVVLTRD